MYARIFFHECLFRLIDSSKLGLDTIRSSKVDRTHLDKTRVYSLKNWQLTKYNGVNA